MKLRQKDFADWLAKNRRRRFTRADPCSCALARFMREVSGERFNVVDDEAYCDDLQVPLPRWAQRFLKKFDALEKPPNGANALELL